LSDDVLDATYRRYFPLIRQKCARALVDRQEAEDVAQDTFIRLWQAKAYRGHPLQISAWIYRTSTRLIVDRLRSRTSRSRLSTIASEPASETLAASLDARKLLTRVAATTPHRELEAAVLSRFDGLSQRELCEVLGVSDRTLRRLLSRFDARMMAMLGEGGP